MSGTSEGRLDALETLIAHQDRAIEEMSAAIAEQWRTIDALKRDLIAVGDRLGDMARRDPREEPPPPHY